MLETLVTYGAWMEQVRELPWGNPTSKDTSVYTYDAITMAAGPIFSLHRHTDYYDNIRALEIIRWFFIQPQPEEIKYGIAAYALAIIKSPIQHDSHPELAAEGVIRFLTEIPSIPQEARAYMMQKTPELPSVKTATNKQKAATEAWWKGYVNRRLQQNPEEWPSVSSLEQQLAN